MNDKFILIIPIAIIVIIFLIWGIYISIISSNNKLYYKHYLKKEWNLWEKVIKKLKEYRGNINILKFDDCPKLNSFFINIEIDSEKYELIYWAKTGLTSVHQGTECILCGYDKYHSNMAAEIMKRKIKEAFNNTDEKTKRVTQELIGEW